MDDDLAGWVVVLDSAAKFLRYTPKKSAFDGNATRKKSLRAAKTKAM